MNENGDVLTDAGVTVPAPSSVIETLVALPPNVLLLTVIDDVVHVVPLLLPNRTVGGLTQPQDTVKGIPVVVQPDEFLTVMV